jgi:hypothetical protein
MVANWHSATAGLLKNCDEQKRSLVVFLPRNYFRLFVLHVKSEFIYIC